MLRGCTHYVVDASDIRVEHGNILFTEVTEVLWVLHPMQGSGESTPWGLANKADLSVHSKQTFVSLRIQQDSETPF